MSANEGLRGHLDNIKHITDMTKTQSSQIPRPARDFTDPPARQYIFLQPEGM